MPRVPIRFIPLGAGAVPMVPFGLKSASAPGARLVGDALVDTGSNVSVVPRELLEASAFPTGSYRKSPDGLHGVGGAVGTTLLPRARLMLLDESGAYHAVNLETIHVTPVAMPPILGRDALEAFSAVLQIDFHSRSGFLELG